MRGWTIVALTLPVLPGAAFAQAARHEMPAILLGNPGEWFGPEDYPTDALAAERQGRVVANISVDLTGTATGCTIAVSSGTTSLDKATCDIALAHAAFNPATNARGRPVTSIYKLPVKWVLPEKPIPIDLNAPVESQIVADGDGMGVSCRTISKRADIPDPCENFRVGSRVGSIYIRDGRKVGTTITIRSYTSVTIDP